MTPVPPPASPCVRVRLIYNDAAGNEAGSRFYLSYTGSAPSGANASTLASDVHGAWASHLASLVSSSFALIEVDVLDIATDTGLSGQWTGQENGTDAASILPASAATNVEFNIARRYRGGKPRMFLPPPDNNQLNTQAAWKASFVAAVNTGIAAFFAELEALDIGSMGTLAHVNLSYYQGFKNITNSSGRERAVPQYRTSALLDTVTGYACKTIVGSQKRRRTSTTP